jgi:hypothetical protein
MQDALKRIVNLHPKRVKKALRIEAEEIMTVSKRDHVPVDLGPLRASGTVGDVTRRGKTLSVPMQFGGASAPYALAVHEHPSDHSPPTWEGKVIEFSPTGRGPKYLEQPMRDAQPELPKRLAAHLDLDDFESVT